MPNYFKRAKAVTKALRSVGYKVKHFKRVNVVKVTLEGVAYYVNPLPNIKKSKLRDAKLVIFEDFYSCIEYGAESKIHL
jgi:hypothetical protein